MKPGYLNPLSGHLRINENEVYELKHWSKQLGVSEERLRAAISQVGPLVDAVSFYLKDEMHPDNPWYSRSAHPPANR